MSNDRPTSEPLLVGVGDLCRMLSISRSSFFSLRSAGRVPLTPVRLSSKLLYRADEVRAWVTQGCPAAERWLQLQGESQ
jgi:predicted DNA-binding transcriptional regulator AlpA